MCRCVVAAAAGAVVLTGMVTIPAAAHQVDPSRARPAVTTDDALQPPVRPRPRNNTNPWPGSATESAGTYDVIVLGVHTPSGDSPATADNSSEMIGLIDDYYNDVTRGRYRLDYRGFVAGTASEQICGPDDIEDHFTNTVENAFGDGSPVLPRSGRAGVIVIGVTAAQNPECGFDGQAWMGSGTQHINGWCTPTLFDLVAHETGHNFGLSHANSASCSGSGSFGSLRTLTWPCSGLEYNDPTSFMGFAGYASHNDLGRLAAEQLDQLGVLAGNEKTRVSAGRDVTLVPLYGLASGVRLAEIEVAGVVRYSLEYRPAAGVEAAFDSHTGGTYAPGGGVQLRIINPTGTTIDGYGTSTGSDQYVVTGAHGSLTDWYPEVGMTPGTSINLFDGTRITVLSADGVAKVRVDRTGNSLPAPTVSMSTLSAVTGSSLARVNGKWSIPARFSLGLNDANRAIGCTSLSSLRMDGKSLTPYWGTRTITTTVRLSGKTTHTVSALGCAGRATTASRALTGTAVPTSKVPRSGKWKTISGGTLGTAKTTTAKKSKATFTVTGSRVAVVLARSAKAAKARIVVDGKTVRTVTTSGKAGSRFVCWAGAWSSSKKHKVVITHVGSKGQRLTVDGVSGLR